MKDSVNTSNDSLARDVEDILKIKKELKAKRRKRNFSGSKLRKHFAEAKRLKEEFCFSFDDIALWLRTKKRVKMTPDGVRSAYRRIEKEVLTDEQSS
jgi:translation initiation factor RLI1